MSKERFQEIKKLVTKASKSLGIHIGPAKSDLIEDENGFQILEMPARLSGGFHSQYTTPLGTGMDPIKLVLQMAVGDDINLDFIKPVRNGYSMCAGVFPKAGKILSIEGIDDALKIDGVDEIICTKGPGDLIENYLDNGKRFFWIITSGDTRESVIQKFETAKSLIRFNID